MLRFLIPLAVLLVPGQVYAAGYVVRPGDTLSQIAHRYQVSPEAVASANSITDVRRLQIGQTLVIPSPSIAAAPAPYPSPAPLGSYHVEWGDTLLGLAARFHMSVPAIRAMNPSLGAYPLAGQWLTLCSPCTGSGALASQPLQSSVTPGALAAGSVYVIQPGDTLSALAIRFGVSQDTLAAVNALSNPQLLIAGSRLTIPGAALTASVSAASTSGQARSLIVGYAQQYGVDPSLALAVGAQESGYDQAAISRTGALGVMQIEPGTASQIAAIWGRRVDLSSLDDNIHAGVFWLAHLLAYYRGDERLALAAYYQGTDALARHGFFQDTQQYVASVTTRRAGGEE